MTDNRNFQIIALYHMGLSYAAIARKTGISRSAVAGVVFRYLKKGGSRPGTLARAA